MSAPLGKLSGRVTPLSLRNYLLSFAGARGFIFGLLSARGAIQTKEAAIENQGHPCSQFQIGFSPIIFCYEEF
jgi:hypothetical protein